MSRLKVIIALGFLFKINILFAQKSMDTSLQKAIRKIDIDAPRKTCDGMNLDSIQGTWIFSGKKSEQVIFSEKDLGLSEKYGRQIFAKIPGVFIYDMDGTGNQLNISMRGLDPHRGWELNNRKDGIITNSDMYGYPASHYNMPIEALEKIEIVRGTGSLQYGAQFGGMINYVSKKPDSSSIFAFENVSTVGSYGLLSSFFRASGTYKKFSYNAWMNNKSLDGYRDNSKSKYDAQNISLFYNASEKLKLKLEFTHSNYIIQLAGPLTDSMFQLDPRMSTRSRNYYNPNIYIPNFSIQFNPNKQLTILFNSSAVLGARNSVLFDKPATVADSIITITRRFNNRQVDIDNFHSFTQELRILYHWKMGNKSNQLAAGMQRMDNNLHRRQLGIGSAGSDFELTLTQGNWGRDLNYITQNLAFFAENRWKITNKFSINTGIRFENGTTMMNGILGYYPSNQIPNKIKHQYPLIGGDFQYNFTSVSKIYGGFSQAYRPVIFKDIIPASIYEITDKNLKDAFGYNAEIGFRGQHKGIRWDISAYELVYNNRIGTISQKDSLGNLLIRKSNIGNSRTRGLEFFIQTDFKISKNIHISIFNSSAYTQAKYTSAVIRNGKDNEDISGNFIESTPKMISRSGLTYKFNSISASILYSYTAPSFADALNALTPNASGAAGLVPEYHLFDFNTSIFLNSNLKIQLNLNNIFNIQYFTNRPQFYPGPGIWPSDGRTWSASVSLSI